MRSQRGFTLIELAVVIALIALFAALAFPTYNSVRRSVAGAEARQYGGEWRVLEWSCLIQHNFKVTKCDTFAKIGWDENFDTDYWNLPGAMDCVATAVDATTALTTAGAVCTDTSEWVRLTVNARGDTFMAGYSYILVIGTTGSNSGRSADIVQ